VIVNLDDVTQHVSIESKGNTYLGSSSVTNTNGFHLANNQQAQLVIPQGCDLWAVTDTGTHAISMLIARVD
jgi:hypothetical protein